MKLITAIIRPGRLAAVRAGLEEHGVQGITVTSASGYGRQKGHRQFYRGAQHTQDLLPKVRIEVLARAEDVDSLLTVILDTAWTGEPGDGKIWTIPVETAIRVSDRQRGDDAI